MPGRTGYAGPLSRLMDGSFNGGPGNCPAELRTSSASSRFEIALQWRAGQLPGRTAEYSRKASEEAGLQWRAGQLPGRTAGADTFIVAGSFPSMEGRAIARPNGARGALRGCRSNPFNGGPGNCPAEPSRAHPKPPRADTPSMEGRAIARPNVDWGNGLAPLPEPSMEGRAIARPNRSLDLGCLTCRFVGVCERSRKLKLRRCSDSVVK